ncbi:hypothetical protein, partial [Rhizobium leguminosarum]|uniref:hypothetical protein n=1 Tax=Rhizobium leguminosarum TaxID=384 RepID=UPI003F9AC2B3
VNSMASNLTAQVRNIAEVSTAISNGDLSNKITVTVSGEILEPTFGADLTRHARHLDCKAVQLVDHRVDGFLEIQDFAGN